MSAVKLFCEGSLSVKDEMLATRIGKFECLSVMACVLWASAELSMDMTLEAPG